MQIFPSLNCNMLIFFFYRGDLLLRRRFVPETFCYRRRSVTETFCYGDVLYGDVLSRRRFVWRRFVCAPNVQVQLTLYTLYKDLYKDANIWCFSSNIVKRDTVNILTLPASERKHGLSPLYESRFTVYNPNL
jgi:hypothetical protein